MDIAHRAGPRRAPHVVAVLAATGHTPPQRRTPHRRTPLAVVGVVAAGAAAGQPAAFGRAGREQVLPSCTRLPR